MDKFAVFRGSPIPSIGQPILIAAAHRHRNEPVDLQAVVILLGLRGRTLELTPIHATFDDRNSPNTPITVDDIFLLSEARILGESLLAQIQESWAEKRNDSRIREYCTLTEIPAKILLELWMMNFSPEKIRQLPSLITSPSFVTLLEEFIRYPQVVISSS